MNISKLFDGKKIDVIGLVNTIANVSERLDSLEKGQSEIKEILSGTLETPSAANMTPLQTPKLIEVVGMEAPWVVDGLTWDGKSEVEDEEELKSFLGFNPNDQDADGKSWCAGFWLKIFEALGFDVSGLDLRAISFATFGYDLMELYPPETLPNGSILVFQPDPEGDFPISHIGVKVDGDKLFGGNQGDKAKRSNLAWYLSNAQLVAARCPDGYKLV